MQLLLAWACGAAVAHALNLQAPVADLRGRGACEQVEPLAPPADTAGGKVQWMYDTVLSSAEFRNASAHRLSSAVQVRTESFDDMGRYDRDERFRVMAQFEHLLARTYPDVYAHAKLERVHEYGLLYTWEGSEPLKPLVLMAHQDVVPVPDETLGRWTHPPFAGHVDDEWVWGRGSADDKNCLMGIMDALSALVGAHFAPRRTIILAFGFDEELSGRQGAAALAARLLDRYGPGSMAAVLDEGGNWKHLYGTDFATPATSEKGYADVRITVDTRGGHSSVPPDHTGIGILSQIISHLEEHPYTPSLDAEHPFASLVHCIGEYGTGVEEGLQAAIDADDYPAIVEYFLPQRPQRYIMQTSQAVDLVHGGVKINALPETAYAVVNHRVALHETTDDVVRNVMQRVTAVAKRFGLSVELVDEERVAHTVAPLADDDSSGTGRVLVSLWADTLLNPAPTAPASAAVPEWRVFAGTIRHVFGPQTVVATSIATGNTDTRYYWSLTRNIYRFSPSRASKIDNQNRAHTVDERMSIDGHVEAVKFYYEFIRNLDALD